MKKIVLAIAAVLMMTVTATAQEEQKNGERKQPTQEQMAQRRTEDMVKKYNLNEEQAAKLLELNKKYNQVMTRRGGGRRGGARPDGNGGMAQAPDSLKQSAPKGERGKADFETMRKQMEEYDAQLQNILTKEQYETYKADRKKMMQRGSRRGNRPTQRQ